MKSFSCFSPDVNKPQSANATLSVTLREIKREASEPRNRPRQVRSSAVLELLITLNDLHPQLELDEIWVIFQKSKENQSTEWQS